VSLVIGPDGYRALPELIEGARQGNRATAVDFDLEEHYEDFRPRRFDGVKAWIPVQRGCDYKCTYCIVPTTRGPERSRKKEDVVREVSAVVAEGIGEIILLGQTVNSYASGGDDFADLLAAVGAVNGVRRLRFTSPHPNDFSDRVVRAMAEIPSVCEHVHLPMQSGSTTVLKRMLRRYSREGYFDCVERLRNAIPGLAVSTDIIVGFPGESEQDFEDTLSAVRHVGFSDAFTFKFSPREGTPATRFPHSETVSDAVAAERLRRLMEEVRSGVRARNLSDLGTRHEVLVENGARRGVLLQARTRDFRTVLIPGGVSMSGESLHVGRAGTSGA
jgi:tRNA-2-methylthio-N6-dimethylallyladenosine synthase